MNKEGRLEGDIGAYDGGFENDVVAQGGSSAKVQKEDQGRLRELDSSLG